MKNISSDYLTHLDVCLKKHTAAIENGTQVVLNCLFPRGGFLEKYVKSGYLTNINNFNLCLKKHTWDPAVTQKELQRRLLKICQK